MNKDDFWMGATAGAIVGMLFITGLSIYLREPELQKPGTRSTHGIS